MYFRQFFFSFLIFIFLFVSSEIYADIVLTSLVAKNSKNCAGNAVYLGPNNVKHHWGSCVSVNKFRIKTKYTRNRDECAKTNWVYVGPNRADKHGGYCASLVSENWKLQAREERWDKDCGGNSTEVYVGANNVRAHWGHCLSIVSKNTIDPIIPRHGESECRSEIWECERPDSTKSEKHCFGIIDRCIAPDMRNLMQEMDVTVSDGHLITNVSATAQQKKTNYERYREKRDKQNERLHNYLKSVTKIIGLRNITGVLKSIFVGDRIGEEDFSPEAEKEWKEWREKNQDFKDHVEEKNQIEPIEIIIN